MSEASHAPSRGKRRVSNGSARNDLVLSANADGNDKAFPRILDLHVRRGSKVADVTYGKGVFLAECARRPLCSASDVLLATDIAEGVDCRDA